ncbi:MAG: cobalt-precorrin-5B (C(1))-methyltransferase CbiD [Oscillospiraceae bacterium]|nr:cobalt-precorrin-5B (C(1))-methyltransferase CbiD [Oscillospiraceae bacterium]
MEEKKLSGGRLLRYGYTTGSCAAAAAKAAALLLLTGVAPRSVLLNTPGGPELTLEIEHPCFNGETASCAVRKDGGDDPDQTNGLLIYAAVKKKPSGVSIDGGEGVGRVTKPGLDQPVGEAAINHVPRQMIETAVREAAGDYAGGFSVVISVPGGAETAKRTFNPYLGIVGGLSILGTTGIVEPMSEKALVETTRVELRMQRAAGREDLLLTVGNYGDDFARETLGLSLEGRVKCSNFIGEALSDAAALGFRSALLVGHLGKLVKLGAGIMNTHSFQGDARMEILTSCALEAGADLPVLRRISACVTTEAALSVLRESGQQSGAMAVLENRIEAQLARRFGAYLELGTLVFCGKETLCRCGSAEKLIETWKR